MNSLFIGAIALAFATPAAAQPAQQGHAQHQGHGQGQSTQHGNHTQLGQHAQHGGAQHEDHSKHKDCCGDANGNGKMDCCDNMAAGAPRPCCAKHEQHGQQAQTAPARPQNR